MMIRSALLSVTAFTGTTAFTQCLPHWFPETSASVFNDEIRGFTQWNGNLVAYGRFTQVGGQPASGVAIWNGDTWAPYGPTVTSPNRRSAIAYDQWLVVDGMVVSPPFWVPLGLNANMSIQRMALYNGVLYAVGSPDVSSPTCVAKFVPWQWVGINYSNSSVLNPFASDLAVYNGRLVVCGNIAAPAIGQPTGIAQWNGTAWSGLNAPTFPSPPLRLAVAQGELFVMGFFNQTGYVYSYNGTSWSLAFTTSVEPTDAIEYNDAVYVSVGGAFRIRRNGSWTTSPTELSSGGFPKANDLTLHRGALVIGGSFNAAHAQPVRNFARFFIANADFNQDGDSATDADIEAFFACIAGNCCPACLSTDLNADGDEATDADIEAFFRVLAGGCA